MLRSRYGCALFTFFLLVGALQAQQKQSKAAKTRSTRGMWTRWPGACFRQ